MTSDLVILALNMALMTRKPQSVIHHSDQGSQYTSIAFGNRCKEMGVRPSMGTVGDAYDNAMAESFMKTLKYEEIHVSQYRDIEHLKAAMTEFIENVYNKTRLHSALGYRPPEEYETIMALENQSAVKPAA